MSWLFTNRFWATRYMKVKRMGITEILRRIGLFSENKIKSSESASKQPTQLIVELNSSLRHIIVTHILFVAAVAQNNNWCFDMEVPNEETFEGLDLKSLGIDQVRDYHVSTSFLHMWARLFCTSFFRLAWLVRKVNQ